MTTPAFDQRHFGKRLREALSDAGRTQAWLAGQMDIAKSRVNEWVCARGSPSLPQLVAIAGHLDVSLDWLLTGRDAASPQRRVVDDLASLAPALTDLARRAEQLGGR